MFGRKPDPIKLQRAALEEEIAQVKQKMDVAYSNFEHVVDPDLIDCYIYEVNAIQKKYKYLLAQIQALYGKQGT